MLEVHLAMPLEIERTEENLAFSLNGTDEERELVASNSGKAKMNGLPSLPGSLVSENFCFFFFFIRGLKPTCLS